MLRNNSKQPGESTKKENHSWDFFVPSTGSWEKWSCTLAFRPEHRQISGTSPSCKITCRERVNYLPADQLKSMTRVRDLIVVDVNSTLQLVFLTTFESACNRNNTHTHTRLTALFPGLPRWAATRKVIPIWILMKQETVSGSGISWAMCKSAPCSRQITMPAPHRSIFYRPNALPAAQPTASKHWRHTTDNRHNTQGEMTSPNLWPRYDRHFVGITWHNMWS